jgi:serine/threonine protein kinase
MRPQDLFVSSLANRFEVWVQSRRLMESFPFRGNLYPESFCGNSSPGKVWPNRKMASHPTKIGKYTVEGVIGRGGMGVVYKAVDSQIERHVAIKMITSGGDESLLERFKSEARSTGSLQCPNIVTIYDFGEQDGNPYLVMQYLEGSSLDAIIQKGVSLTLSERLGIIIDVCNGLAYAHQRGVIHRDIKPANIVVLQDGVNDGVGVIVDFGIARIGGDKTRLTRTDQIIGSIDYMSAEQLQNKQIDNRTDIYSTGVVLFQLLTGALPFDSGEDGLYKIVNEPAPPLSKYLKEYPIELEAVVSRALAKKREERYASAREFASDLQEVQEHLKSETVALLVRRAEASVKREEWTRAREQLQQVLRIDRQNTNAQKLMNVVQESLRQRQQVEQARALRSQADEAYLDQRYDDALRLLDQAVALDSKNADLLAFRDSVRGAKERATGLRRALRRAEAALQDGDLDEAQSAVNEAFKLDPSDTQAKALEVIISQHAEERSRQEQLRKLLDEARNQIAARDLTGAFATLATAEALDPTSNELQSVAKMAASVRQQEKRRSETEELSRQIEAALVRVDYATAVAKAEEGLRKFPQEQRLFKLKALAEEQRVRVEKKKFVREQFAAASSLVDSGQLLQALAVLDRALQRVPGDSELETLRSTVRGRVRAEELEQPKPQDVEATLAEGKRILQERGARSAREFLDTYAVQYSEFPEVRELYDAVRAHEELDTLDSKLSVETNPARRVQLAEEAARSSPDNHWIRQRLADLQQVRDQISAADRARGFEAAGHFSDALREWQQLSDAYPQVPELEEQVRRLASLQAESRKSGIVLPVPDSRGVPTVTPEPSKAGKSAASLSATRVLDSGILHDVDAPRMTSTAPKSGVIPPPAKVGPSGRRTPIQKPTPPDRGRQSENLLAGPNKYIAIALAIVVVVVAYYMFGGKKTVSVRITADPADANVTVGARNCHAPCELKLQPGKYELRAEREGYQALTESVTITADTKPLMLTLKPPPPPPPPAVEQGTLAVRANVEGAEVFLDGTPKGLTDSSKKYQEPKVDVGPHQITVKKSGYEDETQSVEIAKGRTSSAVFTLKETQEPPGQTKLPEPAYLIVQTKPGAAVFIDNQFRGNAAANGRWFHKTEPGSHSIEAKLDGYEPWSGNATAESGKQVPVAAALKEIAKPMPVISFFSPSASSIQAGQPVQLRWKTENATEWSIDPIGSVEGSPKEVSPTKTTIYTLTARGPGGTVKSEPVTVTVNAPPVKAPSIDEFAPGSSSIRLGDSTELFWQTHDATEVFIDGDAVKPTGHRQVNPTQTTTYTLMVKGQVGDPVKQRTTVIVNAPPKVTPTVPGDADAVRDALRRYEEAYATMSLDEVRREWPTASKKKLSDMKAGFDAAKATKLHFTNCQEPTISGDVAQCTCSETLTYTGKNGKVQPPITSPIQLQLKKTGGVWHIDNIS